MPRANQLDRAPDARTTADALLAVPDGPKTAAGLASNVNVAVAYIASWLRGQGAAPIHNLMEDAATAEISRAQVWQQRRHAVVLDDGEPVTPERIDREIRTQLDVWKAAVGDNVFATGRFAEAATVFRDLVLADELPDFLTTPAYRRFFAPA